MVPVSEARGRAKPLFSLEKSRAPEQWAAVAPLRTSAAKGMRELLSWAPLTLRLFSVLKPQG